MRSLRCIFVEASATLKSFDFVSVVVVVDVVVVRFNLFLVLPQTKSAFQSAHSSTIYTIFVSCFVSAVRILLMCFPFQISR